MRDITREYSKEGYSAIVVNYTNLAIGRRIFLTGIVSLPIVTRGFDAADVIPVSQNDKITFVPTDMESVVFYDHAGIHITVFSGRVGAAIRCPDFLLPLTTIHATSNSILTPREHPFKTESGTSRGGIAPFD